jgi:predicted ATPase/class 3 adenylate cyclase
MLSRSAAVESNNEATCRRGTINTWPGLTGWLSLSTIATVPSIRICSGGGSQNGQFFSGVATAHMVTFLFTDIEGSSQLWEQQPEHMRPALARHDALVRSSIASNGGTVVKMTGDGVYAAFDDPVAALAAALAIQCGLVDPDKTNGLELRVRCGVHLGVVERRDGDYFGDAVNRAARIMGAAHGGQVLLSEAVVDRVRDHLPSPGSLRDLGRIKLKNLAILEHVYQLVHPRLRQDFPALRSLETTPNNLPQQISSFVGRGHETAEVKRLVAQNRLLTLVGVGGIGKTRLALQVAADTHDAYPDGVWFVELGSITDASLVASSVAQVLGVREQAGTDLARTLGNHLRSRRLLLLLDNCEHLIDACAALAAALLVAAPEIRILASSRERLQVAGEQTYLVPPLSLPAPDGDLESLARSEAAQMFMERVRLQEPGFVLTERQVAAVTSICNHLDGIPLALELAAARVHSLSIDEINVRLKDRFKLLTGGSRSALPRQQTLRATLDWSYELLASQERVVLDRLAIFFGGFTLEAASIVASDEAIGESTVIDLLSHLVARSLVVVETTVTGSRYRLLETTRSYALEKLAATGDAHPTDRRHAQYFCDKVARAADDWLCTPDADWRAAYLPERDNVRAALNWALGANGDRPIGIALAGASGPIWTELSLYGEGHRRLEAAAAQIDTDTPASAEARLWLWLGLNWALAAPDRAVPALEHAIELYRGLGDARSLGFALARLGHEEAMAGRFDRAASALAEAFPLLENAGLPKVLGDYFDYSGVLKALTGDPVNARSDLEKALLLYRNAGAERYALYTLAQLGDIAWALGDLDTALSGLRETVTLLRKAPLTNVMLGICLSNLAGVHTERGELEEALAAAREGLPFLMEGGFAWSHLDHLALRAGLAGKLANAVRIAGFADSAFAARKTARQPNEARLRDRLQVLLRREYAPDELARLLAEGATSSEDNACKLALDR